LDEVAEVMFRLGSEFIICLLDVLKNDFGEFYEAMSEGDVRPWELIICNVVHPKKELG
jgi:hypothetical protein